MTCPFLVNGCKDKALIFIKIQNEPHGRLPVLFSL